MTAGVLGGLVANNVPTWVSLGNWETRRLASRLPAKVERPIFISGLARAGTTMLLRKISALPGMVSHRYSDYPFLFTPYYWNRLRGFGGSRPEKPRERMHKDGILVTADSPEGMEEVLWMAFFQGLHDPARSNLLGAAAAVPAFDRFLDEHIRKLLLTRGGVRYVSKNNYNVTRLTYLARLFPDARFLLPVREPAAHVASMVKQHRLFSEAEARYPAASANLRRAGHFEFGLNRTPINPGDTATVDAVRGCWATGDEARGWAKYWALIYGYVADLLAGDAALAERCLVVRFEDLCEQPNDTVLGVCRHLDLPTDAATVKDLAEGLRKPDYYQPSFSETERAAIAEETAAAGQRFGY